MFIEDAKQNIVTIRSLNDNSSARKLSRGAIAGFGVAIVIFCILVIGAIMFIFRRRRARNLEKVSAHGSEDAKEKVELDGLNKPALAELYNPPNEADSQEAFKPEMEGSHGGAEMDSGPAAVEMDSRPPAVELDAVPLRRLQNLPAPDTTFAELPLPGIPPEQQRLPSPKGARRVTLPGRRILASAANRISSSSPGDASAESAGRRRWSGLKVRGSKGDTRKGES